MVDTVSFPITPDQLTERWMTETLRDAGVLGSENTVDSMEVSYIGEGIGLLGMVVRVALSYADPDNDAGPESVVIKFAHPVAENRAIATNMNLYEREVTFFREIASQLDVPKPDCYFAAMDYETHGDIVVLEDLRDYRAGDQVKGASSEEVRMIIDALAPLHAKYWGKTDDPQFDGYMRINDSDFIERFMPGAEHTWEACIERFGNFMTDDVRETMPSYIAALREIHQMMGRRKQTLIHGDAKLDNAMFGDGKPGLHPVVMVDWQAIMISTPMQDMAWLLSTSVSTDLRRSSEEEFLRYYCDALAAHGIKDYPIEECLEDYDVALLYILCWSTITSGAFDPTNDRGRELAEECLHRATQAVTDRKLLTRIPA